MVRASFHTVRLALAYGPTSPLVRVVWLPLQIICWFFLSLPVRHIAMENLKDIIVSLIVLLFTFLGKNHTTTHLSAMGDIHVVVQVQVKDKVTHYCYCFKSLSQSLKFDFVSWQSLPQLRNNKIKINDI
jgi:hypothetical protein